MSSSKQQDSPTKAPLARSFDKETGSKFPADMCDGEKVMKWADQESDPSTAILQVDPKGYFIYYKPSPGKDIHTIDFFQCSDIRTEDEAKFPKSREAVSFGKGDVRHKAMTIFFGTDFVNVNFISFFFISVDQTKRWAEMLRDHLSSLRPLNITPLMNLERMHSQIIINAKEQGIPVKFIQKYFTQSKEDKKTVENALAKVKLPSSKNKDIPEEVFTFEKFKELYLELLSQRSDVDEMFRELCKSDPESRLMNATEFLDFLNNVQRDSRLNEILHPIATEAKARALIKKYEPDPNLGEEGKLGETGFLWFLMSEDNRIVPVDKQDKYLDMDRPLSHYYIKSSHNTYLTGHQITGKANLEMYRQVLLSGCRCIELDFWNGQKEDDEPIITHGYTLVNKMPARDVLETIAEYAFKTTDSPLILSFENHCNPKQQAKIAKYCKEFFKDKLLEEPLEKNPLEKGVPLPSPNALRGKILIKNKKQHHHKVKKDNKPASQSTPSSPSSELAAGEVNNNSLDGGSDSSDDEEDTSVTSDTDQRNLPTSDAGTAGKESQATAEISALVIYIQPVHFKSFEHAENLKRAYEMSSFVETTALNLLKTFPGEFANYNKFQLSRVYPRGTRVDSSNFPPHVYWMAGCQLVALNYQTLDIPMQLNIGIFQYSQKSGYMLKPDILSDHERAFDPFVKGPVDNIVPATLTVKIISGQFLSDKRVGVYVEVEMYGIACDTVKRGKMRTKTVLNGINSIFSEESFTFPQIVLPDLAVLRVAAFEEGNKMIGHRILFVNRLPQGYRHMQLYNEMGQPLQFPSLFVQFDIKDYVQSTMIDFAEALANPIKYQSHQQLINERTETIESLYEGGLDVASPQRTKLAESEILKRVGSGKQSPHTSSINLHKEADHQSVMPSPQRSDSSKNLKDGVRRENSKGSESASSNGLESVNVKPSSIEDIMNSSKSIKEKEAELAVKLEQLKKKLQKEEGKLENYKQCAQEKLHRVPSKSKNPLQRKSLNKIVKKFSTATLESGASSDTKSESGSTGGGDDMEVRQENVKKQCLDKEYSMRKGFIMEEAELREKYVKSIFSSVVKALTKAQASQLSELESTHKKESDNVMKRIEAQNYAQDEKSDSSVSKEDMQREKRQRLVKKGVQERSNLENLFKQKEQQCQEGYKKAFQEVEEERAKRLKDIEANKKDMLNDLEKMTGRL